MINIPLTYITVGYIVPSGFSAYGWHRLISAKHYIELIYELKQYKDKPQNSFTERRIAVHISTNIMD